MQIDRVGLLAHLLSAMLAACVVASTARADGPPPDRGLAQPGDDPEWDNATGTLSDGTGRGLDAPPKPEPVPKTAATAEGTKAALATFRKAFRARSADQRVAALEALGAVNAEAVVKEVGKILRKEEDPLVRCAAYDVLRRFVGSPHIAEVAELLDFWIAEEADRERKRVARGESGIRTDPKTGEADLDSVEGRRVFEATERRGRAVATLLAAAREAHWAIVAGEGPDLSPLLQSSDDYVVVSALVLITAAKDERALPELAALYHQYPAANRYETGGVTDLSGDNASAKAKWMVRFGHPNKQRARPAVHAALIDAIRAITGKDFASPQGLDAWLKKK